jgi:hypothetical protein
LRAHIASLREAGHAGREGTGRGAKRRKGASGSGSTPVSETGANSKHRVSEPVDHEVISCSHAQQFCPLGARLYKDVIWCNRWQIYLPPFGQLSRSFGLYGEVGALKKCLRWGWEHHALGRGTFAEVCPFPWLAATDWRVGK